MGKLVELYYPEAPSGLFAVTLHGSSGAPATAYSDYECAFVSSNRTLTAAGRAHFWVKDLVNLEVVKSTGEPVVFLQGLGEAGTCVDLRSISFTGTNPTGGADIPGGIISVKAAMDLWFESSGTRDFLIRRTGQVADETLVEAFDAVLTSNTFVFNVKDYGAVGDGVTDDTAAISAAVTALNLNGGGVLYFPVGTYLTTATISLNPDSAIIRGDGQFSSLLKSSNSVATFSMGTFSIQIEDIGIETTSTSATLLDAAFGIYIKNSNWTGPITGTNSFSLNFVTGVIESSSFNLFTAALTGAIDIIGGTVGDDGLVIRACVAVCPLVSIDTADDVFIRVSGNHINSAALIYVINAGIGSQISATDNITTPFFPTLISVAAGSVGISITESGNNIAQGATWRNPIVLGATGTGNFVSLSRKQQVAAANGASASPRLGAEVTTCTATGNFTINFPVLADGVTAAFAWPGAEVSIQIHNSTGGNITISFGAGMHGIGGNLATLTTTTYRFRYTGTGGVTGFIQQGARVDVT